MQHGAKNRGDVLIAWVQKLLESAGIGHTPTNGQVSSESARSVRNAILLQPDTPVKMNGKAMGSKCASMQITRLRSQTDTWKARATLDRKLRRGEEEETGSLRASSQFWELPPRWYLGELSGRRDRAAPWC